MWWLGCCRGLPVEVVAAAEAVLINVLAAVAKVMLVSAKVKFAASKVMGMATWVVAARVVLIQQYNKYA